MMLRQYLHNVIFASICFVLFNFSSLKAEEWQFMFDNGLQKVSYDPTSLSNNKNGLITVLVKYDYGHAYWVEYAEIHFNFEIDCTNRKMRTLFSKRFNKSGKRLENGSVTDWQAPRDDGPTENIYLYFCKN